MATAKIDVVEESDVIGSSALDAVTCKLCFKNAAKYTCPRCNIRYCSSECYKATAHAQCSESFYRDCFMEGLHDMRSGDPDDRRKVMDMLKKLRDEEAEDEDDSPDLSERLEGLDLDGDTDTVWKRLTADEKKQFEVMLGDGRLGNMVELWQPWWKNKRLVEEIKDDASSQEQDNSTPPPAVMQDIPNFQQLCSKPPSDTVRYSVVNILYSYVYLARLHNGDLRPTGVHSAQDLLKLCRSLKDVQFADTSEAVHSCMACLQQQAKSLYVAQHFSVAALEDLQLIIGSRDRDWTLAALSDTREIFRTAKKLTDRRIKKSKSKDPKVQTEGLEERKKCYFRCQKKLEYLLSWTAAHWEKLNAVTMEIDLLFCEMSTDLARHLEEKQKLESAWGGTVPPAQETRRPLVEEIADR